MFRQRNIFGTVILVNRLDVLVGGSQVTDTHLAETDRLDRLSSDRLLHQLHLTLTCCCI